MPDYDQPEVDDLGRLEDMTAALGFTGPEDGATKAVPMHHVPDSASGAVSP